MIGNTSQFDTSDFAILDGVDDVVRISAPYKIASREFKPDNTIIKVGSAVIGGREVVVMAGPVLWKAKSRSMVWPAW